MIGKWLLLSIYVNTCYGIQMNISCICTICAQHTSIKSYAFPEKSLQFLPAAFEGIFITEFQLKNFGHKVEGEQ